MQDDSTKETNTGSSEEKISVNVTPSSAPPVAEESSPSLASEEPASEPATEEPVESESEPAEPETPQETLSESDEKPADDEPSEEKKQPLKATTGSNDGASAGKKVLITLLVLALIGGLGYLAYKAFGQKSSNKTVVAVAVKHDIPKLTIDVYGTPINAVYPTNDLATQPVFLINNQLFEGLVQFKNGTKISPSLATSWSNPDDNTWVFNLQKGVKFHTGNVLTAADVKYSIEKYQKDAWEAEFGIDLKEVTVVNDNQVKITTNTPDPLLLNKLAYLYIVDSKLAKDGDANGGTGPYVIKPGTTPTETSFDLVAFKDYHGGHIYTKELNFVGIDDDEQINKDLLAKKADFGFRFATQSLVDELKKDSSVTIRLDPSLGVSFIGINHNSKNSPLLNLKVRQAIDQGLDRNAVVKAADLTAVPASQIVTQAVTGYNPAIKATPLDAAKAKQAVIDAGYANGATFTLTHTSGAKAQAENIATQLKAIGITVKLDPVDDFSALLDKVAANKTDAFIESYSTDLLDGSDPIAYINSGSETYTNADVQKLLDDSSKTLDQKVRLANLQKSSKLLVDDLAWIPDYSISDNSAYQSAIKVSFDSNIGPYFWQTYK